MWIFWAVISMLGTTVWYIGPKFFPSQNPFSVLFFWALFSLLPLILLSKFFYGEWIDTQSWKLGAFYLLSNLGTIGLILSINSGGKIGIISLL